jgi:hypothetical protein
MSPRYRPALVAKRICHEHISASAARNESDRKDEREGSAIQDDDHKRDGRYAATVMHEVGTCTNFPCENAQTGRQLSPGDQKNQKKPK